MSFSKNLINRLGVALTSRKAATEFNNIYNVTTAGTAEASKALVLDASKGISTITSATITTLTTSNVSGGGSTVAYTDRITTTDGVSSGTAGVVGRLLYSSIADSTPVASTSVETFFDTYYNMPAGTLKANSVLFFRYFGVATTTVANDTVAYKAYLATNTTAGSIAGNTLLSHAATDAANSDTFLGECMVTCRTAGNSGTAVSVGTLKVSSAEGTMTVKDDVSASFTINTNAAQAVGVSAAWSHTSNANSCLLRQLAVWIY